MPSVAIIGTRGYPSYYGGFETAVRMLAPYLADHGWDVTVYGRRSSRSTSLDADERITSTQTPGIDSKSASTLSYGLTSSIAAALKKPDVALVMNVANGFFLPLLRARAVPTLVNVDGIEWEREKWGRTARRVFLDGARQTARHATELVFDSLEIKRRWRQDFGRSGQYIPYGGIAPLSLSEPPLGLKRGEYALYVARFVPENSVEPFFQAAEEVAKARTVVIVGSSGYGDPYDARATALSRRNSNIITLGHVNDDELLHALWQNAGAYFHGHSVGGTNPALVQAMALGAPTVARDTPYNREVLGGNGIFVAPEAGAISKAIQSVLSDAKLQAELSVAVAERARRVYDWADVNRRYERALRALIPGGARHD